jgi:phosphoribosylformylglycinamidine (FGAM) synthase PurS component
VEAVDESAARGVVDRLAGELLANPLIESWSVETLDPVGAAS